MHLNNNTKNESIRNIANFMTYNGNSKLFHFTKFESALKIIATNKLLFGEFANMNDISESRREIHSDALTDEIQLYKSLSFTIDHCKPRAFAIDPLWGYYAEKGNGVCLVFDKAKLTKHFNRLNGFRRRRKIHYIKNFTNSIFPNETLDLSARKEVEKTSQFIFFTKSIEWKVENEYRFLIRPNSESITSLNFADSLIAVIICCPLIDNIKDSIEYKTLKRQTKIPILWYCKNLGAKELREIENNELLWPLLGVDYYIDI